jgi:hypothetical protein
MVDSCERRAVDEFDRRGRAKCVGADGMAVRRGSGFSPGRRPKAAVRR